MDEIRWIPLEKDWVALNTDRSVVKLGNNAIFGGILCDSYG
jgi:hypothetical protein